MVPNPPEGPEARAAMIFRRHRKPSTEDVSAAIAGEILEIAAVVEQYSGELPQFGAPTRCPGCNSFGMVTAMVPAPVPLCENECPSCRTAWTITRRALRAVRRAGNVEQALAQLTGEPEPILVATPAMPLTLGASTDTMDTTPSGLSVPAGPLSLLLVEDDPADAALVEAILEPAHDVHLQQAWSRGEGEKLSRDPDIDLVLLDLGLPDSSGLTTLSRWQPRRAVPLMVLSGNDNGGLIDASYEYGVRGFMHKQGLADLLDAGSQGTEKMVKLIRENALAVG